LFDVGRVNSEYTQVTVQCGCKEGVYKVTVQCGCKEGVYKVTVQCGCKEGVYKVTVQCGCKEGVYKLVIVCLKHVHLEPINLYSLEFIKSLQKCHQNLTRLHY